MKVINLFAGPSAGKSTTGAVLYGMLSMAGYAAEYVAEFAKFATFAKLHSALTDQLYMVGKQHNRLHVLKNAGLDYVVMDGPLPQAVVFAPDGYFKHYEPLVMEAFNAYDNINFFLERNPEHAYRDHGRNEPEEQGRGLCGRVRELLDRHGVAYFVERVDSRVAARIFERITGVSAPL